MYYRHSCSPYDVQSEQGGRFTFETVKQRYQSTLPIRGKRKADNVRPIKRRDRSWERIFEVDENEYYISFDAYKFRPHHNRAITWKMVGDMEYMTIHTPRKTWSSTDFNELHPRTLSSASIYWFYDFNLPHGFNMVNHYANKYVKHNDLCYTIEQGDITFQRRHSNTLNKLGENNWQPLVVHTQFKHHIDRTKTKELKEAIKPFVAYFDVMSGMVQDKYGWGNPIVNAVVGDDNYNHTVIPEQAVALFKQTGDDVPDSWLTMVERYKRKITRHDYRTRQDTYAREELEKEICKDLFRIVRPCKNVEVPLGQVAIDRYKSWYR